MAAAARLFAGEQRIDPVAIVEIYMIGSLSRRKDSLNGVSFEIRMKVGM